MKETGLGLSWPSAAKSLTMQGQAGSGLPWTATHSTSWLSRSRSRCVTVLLRVRAFCCLLACSLVAGICGGPRQLPGDQHGCQCCWSRGTCSDRDGFMAPLGRAGAHQVLQGPSIETGQFPGCIDSCNRGASGSIALSFLIYSSCLQVGGGSSVHAGTGNSSSLQDCCTASCSRRQMQPLVPFEQP